MMVEVLFVPFLFFYIGDLNSRSLKHVHVPKQLSQARDMGLCLCVHELAFYSVG